MTTRQTSSLTLAALLLLGLAVILGVGSLIFHRVQQSHVQQRQHVEVKTKAVQGDAEAQSNLGDQYYYGEGTAKDPEEAVKWWLKAAEQGDAKSQFSLAYSYYKGRGVKPDPAQGAKWYKSAMDQGFNIQGAALRFESGDDIRVKSPGQ